MQSLNNYLCSSSTVEVTLSVQKRVAEVEDTHAHNQRPGYLYQHVWICIFFYTLCVWSQLQAQRTADYTWQFNQICMLLQIHRVNMGLSGTQGGLIWTKSLHQSQRHNFSLMKQAKIGAKKQEMNEKCILNFERNW